MSGVLISASPSVLSNVPKTLNRATAESSPSQIDYSLLEFVAADAAGVLYKYDARDYVVYFYKASHSQFDSYYIHGQDTPIKTVQKLLKKHKKIYYFNFVARTTNFYRGRKIKLSDARYQHEDIAEGIKNKIELHKDMHICLLLHGAPGTGKSQFVEHIATITHRNVYVVPSFEYDGFEDGVKSLSNREHCIVLVPEIDKYLNAAGEIVKNHTVVLELLNGCYTPRNAIIIITCNDVAKVKLNPILSRPGRIHFELEFKGVTMQQIHAIITKYYPDYSDFAAFEHHAGAITVSEFATAISTNYIQNRELHADKLQIVKIASKKRNLLYI